MLTIYGDSISGNCHKVKWVADHLGLPYHWIETSVLSGATRTQSYLALNPAGRFRWRSCRTPLGFQALAQLIHEAAAALLADAFVLVAFEEAPRRQRIAKMRIVRALPGERRRL
ncbi:MAG TPA: hypothetical protein VMU59_07865 [Caulobacteraceae bacterium]|nr:hypothetical protein [Caulobacteraceae bacterium]